MSTDDQSPTGPAELERAKARIAELEARLQSIEGGRAAATPGPEALAAIVDRVPVMLWFTGPDARLNYFNDCWLRFRGRTLEQELGDGWIDGVHPEDRERILTIYLNAFERREQYEMEYRLQRHDGQYRRVFDRASPWHDDRGIFRGFVGACADITDTNAPTEEHRRAGEQLLHAQKLESLGLLAGGIAHDFNNLLIGLLGNAGLALGLLPRESPARPHLHDIELAARRAADLTRQLLAYSGKGRFVVERLDVSKVFQETAHLLEAAVSKKAVIRYDLQPSLPAVEADATQLRQVIMNLIANASDAIQDRSGVISVATGLVYADAKYLDESFIDSELPEGEYVFLEISDTGCGMDADTRTRIFDPFFTTKFTGRGLGLAAVLGIVRAHHGTVRVYSEPGRGTSMKVLFPATEHPARPTTARQAAAELKASGAVLVADDEELVRSVARAALEMAGFEVITARDGREAVDLFKEHHERITAVLLDMTMPRLSGEEVFREIRHVRPEVPVILSSGYNEQDATNRFAGKGLAGFLQKPYRPQDLFAKLAEVLDEPRTGSAEA